MLEHHTLTVPPVWLADGAPVLLPASAETESVTPWICTKYVKPSGFSRALRFEGSAPALKLIAERESLATVHPSPVVGVAAHVPVPGPMLRSVVAVVGVSWGPSAASAIVPRVPIAALAVMVDP